jgi:hypothetical protein
MLHKDYYYRKSSAGEKSLVVGLKGPGASRNESLTFAELELRESFAMAVESLRRNGKKGIRL